MFFFCVTILCQKHLAYRHEKKLCCELLFAYHLLYCLGLCSLINPLDAGSAICGNKDGINQEVLLPCSINRWICPSSIASHRLRASLHTLLATHPPLGFGLLLAGVCCWCMAAEVLPWYSKEGTTQGLKEEGISQHLALSFIRDGFLVKYIGGLKLRMLIVWLEFTLQFH